jgi:hypothetical protein
MITYVGYGHRELPRNASVYPRQANELLVILEGRCGLTKPGFSGNSVADGIWFLPKGSRHGWHWDGAACRLLSVMFPRVEGSLGEALGSCDGLHTRQDAMSRQRFDQLGERLFAHRDDYEHWRT